MSELKEEKKASLACAVLTVSDTRTAGNDTSGNWLAETLARDGHDCVRRDLVKDNVYEIRRVVSDWIADTRVQVILITGGTGFSHRDSTPEAVAALLDKEITGFGELFRHVSYQEIGSSTIQSRALAGYANDTVIFCLPGSTGACETAWNHILREQLDSRHKPCNFASHLQKKALESKERAGR
ncbi:molybdenum cofactor biosynthesis protein B [Bordetella bronchialis]|uniref:Molybdenum cofactor biosynthesis protein B n=1 Tax=Bordetella bronchialis TaxID=463025 RepID=A0A193FLN8_9BORD|nr:molybdenum cofactor biosynthesis protein B [Bordetella bronchialis]ANN68590.1 molybdenum cofactor biosynthesis protein B [Bordetella bronchialis]ANN73728.1 molybdenum cofactor biosynthesis protein B [Bordetella bronchialis]